MCTCVRVHVCSCAHVCTCAPVCNECVHMCTCCKAPANQLSHLIILFCRLFLQSLHSPSPLFSFYCFPFMSPTHPLPAPHLFSYFSRTWREARSSNHKGDCELHQTRLRSMVCTAVLCCAISHFSLSLLRPLSFLFTPPLISSLFTSHSSVLLITVSCTKVHILP